MARLTDGGWVDLGLPQGVTCRTVAAHEGKLFTITQRDQNSWDFQVLMLEQGQWLDITNLPATFFPQSLWDVNGELFLSSTSRAGGWEVYFAESTQVLHWNGAGWDGVGTDISNVAAMFPFNGQVIGAGLVVGCDGHAAEGLAAWDGATWQPLGSGISYVVGGLAEFRGELVACGGIRTTNPADATGLLVLRDGSWQRLIPQNVLGGMTSYGNDLILAYVGDTQGLLRFDGTELQPIGPQGVFADRPMVIDGDLYCLGYDTVAGGYVVDRLNGSEWVQVGGRFGGPVSTLFSHEGRLFVGGQFPIIHDGEFAGAIGVFDGENWVDPDPTVTERFLPLYVSCAAEFMGQLIIGGDFAGQVTWTGAPSHAGTGATLSLIENPPISAENDARRGR